MIRSNSAGHNGKYHNKTGTFFPVNRHKYAGNNNPEFKSLLEYRMMRYLDNSPAVVKWNYEPFPIPYTDKSTGKQRRYYIDFIAQIRISETKTKTVWLEIKSFRETVKPKNSKNITENLTWLKNQCKWTAAKALAKSKGYEFIVLTEKQLV